MSSSSTELVIKNKGLCPYDETYLAMSSLTDERDASTEDEIWFLQHSPVYTLGLSGRREHLLNIGDIPVVETDRGGQVTYHGPGQLMVYLLIDIKRKSIGVKDYVRRLEQSVIDMLDQYGISGHRKAGAPGVYVDDKKVSALGIRVRKGCTYHGLSINVDMDLMPYQGINPCGYAGLEVTQMKDLGVKDNIDQVEKSLIPFLLSELNYSDTNINLVNSEEVNSGQAA